MSTEEAIQRLSRSPQWVWTAIDPQSKLLLAIEGGPRTQAMAQRVVHQVVQGFCRKVAFLRPNVKIVCCKISDLRASTFLFSVICDRTNERVCPILFHPSVGRHKSGNATGCVQSLPDRCKIGSNMDTAVRLTYSTR